MGSSRRRRSTGRKAESLRARKRKQRPSRRKPATGGSPHYWLVDELSPIAACVAVCSEAAVQEDADDIALALLYGAQLPLRELLERLQGKEGKEAQP